MDRRTFVRCGKSPSSLRLDVQFLSLLIFLSISSENFSRELGHFVGRLQVTDATEFSAFLCVRERERGKVVEKTEGDQRDGRLFALSRRRYFCFSESAEREVERERE